MISKGLPSVLVSELVSKIRSATLTAKGFRVVDSQLNSDIICLLSMHKARQRARQHNNVELLS